MSIFRVYFFVRCSFLSYFVRLFMSKIILIMKLNTLKIIFLLKLNRLDVKFRFRSDEKVFFYKRKSWWSWSRLLSLAVVMFVYNFFTWKVYIILDYVEYTDICDEILSRSSSILYDWMSLFFFLKIYFVAWSTIKNPLDSQ